MKILFHDNQLGERGTSVALYDYAYYSREYLGVDPIIVYNKNAEHNNKLAEEKFKNEFEVIEYDNFSEVEKIINNKSAEYFYCIKSGFIDNIQVSNAKTLVHSVYCYEPSQSHGYRYATVSEWQSSIHGNVLANVPHMINLPNTGKDLRKELSIPRDAIVFGRHGGIDTFDVPFIKSIIKSVNSPFLIIF